MIDGSAFDPDNWFRPMQTYPKSQQILEANRRFIPGGVVSINRSVAPEIVFVRGEGPLIWDADETWRTSQAEITRVYEKHYLTKNPGFETLTDHREVHLFIKNSGPHSINCEVLMARIGD